MQLVHALLPDAWQIHLWLRGLTFLVWHRHL